MCCGKSTCFKMPFLSTRYIFRYLVCFQPVFSLFVKILIFTTCVVSGGNGLGWQCHNITTHPDYTWDHGVLSIQQADSSTIPTMGIIFALLIFGTLALLSWWRDTQYFQFPQPDLVTPRPLQVCTPFIYCIYRVRNKKRNSAKS